jgi:molybdopterin synthase catalytic subunit
MKVKVLYFATLRDRSGVREETFELPDDSTVLDIKHAVVERHPEVEPSLETSICAVNREFAGDEQVLANEDEIALFPPVSGGNEPPTTIFKITRDEIDMNRLLEEMVQPTTGAACIFSGMVREKTERGEARETRYLRYEAYEPMAEAKMAQVAGEIRERWTNIEAIAIIQRIGDLDPGTPTVLIACTAAHRDTGVFEAARYGIDRLKQIVPIWKKEVGAKGEVWIEGDYQPAAEDRKDAGR